MANLGKRVNLALTDEDKIDALMPIPMDKPEYPCGMRIAFCEPELSKMDIEELPEEGTLLEFRVFAEVTRAISDSSLGRRLECQITDILDYENESAEFDE